MPTSTAGVHTLSEEATAQYEGVRAQVSTFINATCPKEVIWTRNASEALNVVAYSWGRANSAVIRCPAHRDGVPLQHRAVANPRRGTRNRARFRARRRRWHLDLGQPEQAADPCTKPFGFTYMSTIVGTINPVKEVTQARTRSPLCRRRVPGRAAQAGGRVGAGRRFPGVSGDKMLGPRTAGGLPRCQRHAALDGRGRHDPEMHLSGFKSSELPWKFEACTRPSCRPSASAWPWII